MNDPNWILCTSCRGTGTVAYYYGDGSFDPGDCDRCKGHGAVRARDSRGRFISLRGKP